MFSRQVEVTFQPGNERLTIKQDFKGIDEHDHLVVSTELEGRLPEVPRGSSVQIDPYKEIYQYTTNRKVIPPVLFWDYSKKDLSNVVSRMDHRSYISSVPAAGPFCMSKCNIKFCDICDFPSGK